MAPVAPSPPAMDRDALVTRFGDMEAEGGVHEFANMSDGWRIHRETWTPSAGPATAVVLFSHGNGESTRTIGVRRLAHACLRRGFILETFDTNGHGESLEKGGQMLAPKGFRGGSVEPASKRGDHMVEIAELVIKKHRLPLIIAGHSGGGEATCMATDRIVALCEENSVPFVVALYLAPGLGFGPKLAPMRSVFSCCWVCCCCNCCGKPCIGTGDAGYNPDGVLGEDNTLRYINFDQLLMEGNLYPKGGADVPDAAAHMTRLKDGLVFIGSKDENIPAAAVHKLAELVGPALKVEVYEGLKHDFLNVNKVDGDLTSVKTIEHIIGYAEAKLKSMA